MRLGIIADDFTGATDIAGFLVANGLSTIQLNGVPDNAASGRSRRRRHQPQVALLPGR